MSTHTLSPKSSNESLKSNSSAFSSPDKLAPAVASPMVWEGLDAASYIIELNPREVQDIRAAVIKVKSMLDVHDTNLTKLMMASRWHTAKRNPAGNLHLGKSGTGPQTVLR
jgi:hypothetical protein